MTFKKGDPKPPGSGRKKGVPHKRTVAARAGLADYFAKHDVVLEDEIAKYIKKGDMAMVRALTGLLPYMQPRIASEVAPDKPKDEPKKEEEQSPAELLSIIQGTK